MGFFIYMKDLIFYNLFLDDYRVPKDCVWVDLPLVEWSIVRNYKDFVSIIGDLGLPRKVSFDMDLSDEHYDRRTWLQEHPNYKEKDGIECVKFLIDYCKNNNLKFPKYYIHSMNPIKTERAFILIKDFISEK